MASAPERYIEWINEHVGFNPRGQKHSDYLTDLIYNDLYNHCAMIRQHVDSERLKLVKNVGVSGRRNSSLAGVPSGGSVEPNIDGVIQKVGQWPPNSPSGPAITLENKTIMTAHGKARMNRYNDACAYASQVHGASKFAIAAFTIVINTATTYTNPDAFTRAAQSTGTNHPGAAKKTIEFFSSEMRLRDNPTGPISHCEAVLILAIEYDGKNPTARLVTTPPAPDPSSHSSHFSYQGFLTRICCLYEKRFGRF